MTKTSSQGLEVRKEGGEEGIDCEFTYRDWASLPEEILALIISTLDFHDVNKFRSVCKAWQLVKKDRIGFGSQCLVKKNWDESMVTLFHPLSSQAYSIDIPELLGAHIRFSKDGWLLMSRGYRGIFFFHPFTRLKIKLPNLPQVYNLSGITFTSNPTAEDCVVFGISAVSRVYIQIFTISHGERKWSVTEIDDDHYPYFYPSYTNPVYHKGKFYTLCKYGELGIFDPSNNGWNFVCAPGLKYLYESYLLDFNGELVSVFVALMGTCISILKWDEYASEWIFVDDLGGHMLFLSETTSFAKKSLTDRINDKIYFPRFHDNYGVFFNMENDYYETFGDDFSKSELYGTKLQLECSWIEPTKEIGLKLVDWFGNLISDASTNLMVAEDGDNDSENSASGDSSEDGTSDDSSEDNTSDDSSKNNTSDDSSEDSMSDDSSEDGTSEDSSEDNMSNNSSEDSTCKDSSADENND